MALKDNLTTHHYMSYVEEWLLHCEQMLLIGDQVRIVIQLLSHEEVLRVQQFTLHVVFKWVVPHNHNCLLQEVHCILLDDVCQLVLPDVKYL